MKRLRTDFLKELERFKPLMACHRKWCYVCGGWMAFNLSAIARDALDWYWDPDPSFIALFVPTGLQCLAFLWMLSIFWFHWKRFRRLKFACRQIEIGGDVELSETGREHYVDQANTAIRELWPEQFADDR